MHKPDLFVTSADATLAVYTWGEKPSAERPRDVVVLAHGFPDRALFWEKVATALQDSHYVVAFDMRGCAESSHLRGMRHYRFAPLIADLCAVIDAVSPDQKVYLVGHDWGGIYGWNAICSAEGEQRIAGFLTLSPALEHVGSYLRRRMAHPTPRNLMQLGMQLVRNSLMTFFTLPLLPELLFLSGLGTVMFRVMVGRFEPDIRFHKNDGMEGDAIRYLGIYRANLLQRTLFGKAISTRVPVHVLMAQRDPFLPPAVFEHCRASAESCSESFVDAAHWAPLSRPQELADAIAGFTARTAMA